MSMPPVRAEQALRAIWDAALRGSMSPEQLDAATDLLASRLGSFIEDDSIYWRRPDTDSHRTT